MQKRKDSNKTSDKLQHAKYVKVLDTKEVPRSFDKWQELKYNDSERYSELKQKYRYANNQYLQNRFDYVMPNGKKDFVPKSAVFENVKTIAGDGSDTVLRVEQKLVDKYGGNVGEWSKKVGKIESEKYIFDLHWYEVKLKHRGEKK